MDGLVRFLVNLLVGVPTPRQVRRLRVGTLRSGAWHPVAWWTLLVLAVLLALTVVGLPFAAGLAVALVVRSPYAGGSASWPERDG